MPFGWGFKKSLQYSHLRLFPQKRRDGVIGEMIIGVFIKHIIGIMPRRLFIIIDGGGCVAAAPGVTGGIGLRCPLRDSLCS